MAETDTRADPILGQEFIYWLWGRGIVPYETRCVEISLSINEEIVRIRVDHIGTTAIIGISREELFNQLESLGIATYRDSHIVIRAERDNIVQIHIDRYGSTDLLKLDIPEARFGQTCA